MAAFVVVALNKRSVTCTKAFAYCVFKRKNYPIEKSMILSTKVKMVVKVHLKMW